MHVGGRSLQTIRDKDEYRQWRRLWNLAISATALREYGHRLYGYVLLLVSKLKKQAT